MLKPRILGINMNFSSKNKVKDKISNHFGNDFMDNFHDYASKISLWRYHHRCRIDRIDSYLAKLAHKSMIGLDAGSGKGPSSAIMSNYLNNIYSIESDEENLKRQKKNLRNFLDNKDTEIRVIHGDITRIDLPDNYVDIIICSEVIEHIPDYKQALRELRRVLKNKGKIIFSMPNIRSSFWMNDMIMYYLVKIVRKIKRKPLDNSGYSFWERSRHWAFSSKKIRKIIQEANLKILEESGISFLIFNEWTFKNFVWNRFFKTSHNLEKRLAEIFPRFSGIYFLLLEKEEI